MYPDEKIRAYLLDVVSRSPKHRIRPRNLEHAARDERGISRNSFRRALSALVGEKKLVYTYRDPCSFVEIPEVESQNVV